MKSNILSGDAQLGPFPVHRLKRVDRPTTIITDNIQRVDSRETAFARAARGDYGNSVKGNLPRHFQNCPLAIAQRDVTSHVSSFKEGPVATLKHLSQRIPRF